MTVSISPQSSSAPACHRAGDAWRGGPLCDREARPVLPDPSYPDLLPQVVREGAKPVWLSTPDFGPDYWARLYAGAFRRAVDCVGHAQAQGAPRGQNIFFVSPLCPGQFVPPSDAGAAGRPIHPSSMGGKDHG